MFQITAIPFDEYDALDIADGPRWLLVRLARYADRDGRCFPSMRTLAAGAKKSLATTCRWLKKLEAAGCFTRSRKAGARYLYVLSEPYRLSWRERPKPEASQSVSGAQDGVSPSAKQGVSQHAKQQVNPIKHSHEVTAPAPAGAPSPAPARSAPVPTTSSQGFGYDENFKWRSRVRQYQKTPGQWLAAWGAAPGQPGCIVSPKILAEFGFASAAPLQTGA